MKPIIEQTMEKRYPGIKFVALMSLATFTPLHGKETLPALPGNLKKYQVDAVITGLAAAEPALPRSSEPA